MTILDELKLKANGAADPANNIQEAISMMEFGGGGLGSSAFIINVITSMGEGSYVLTLDKTWQEIYDAHSSGALCLIRHFSDITQDDGYRFITHRSEIVVTVSEENDINGDTIENRLYVRTSDNDFVSDTSDGHPHAVSE